MDSAPTRRRLQMLKAPGNSHQKAGEMQESKPTDTEKATTSGRVSTRHREIALLHDVAKLKKKLIQEENIHRALNRAFNRPLGSLPRLPPYLPPHMLELVAEVAVLEEEVIRLEEKVFQFTEVLYRESLYMSENTKKKEKEFSLIQKVKDVQTMRTTPLKFHVPV